MQLYLSDNMAILKAMDDNSIDSIVTDPPYGFSKDIGAVPLKKNKHPTVKPISLMRYLVRMITPKGAVCLDPFMGSGTTGIACTLEGMDFIGIENNAQYYEVAKARIDNSVGEVSESSNNEITLF